MYARLFRSGQCTDVDLDAELQTLREEFAAHNDLETKAMRRLLTGPAPWNLALLDRMLEEHVAEHAAFWELLSGTHLEVAERIDDLADELEAHMAAEERTFLAPTTMRDDVIEDHKRDEVAE